MDMNILVLDQDETVCDQVKRIAKSHSEIKGVDTANNLIEGFKLLKKVKPNIIITSVNWGKDSILDLLSQVTIKNAKVIFISDKVDFAFNALKFGATDYILKPISELELIQAIDKAKDQIEYQIMAEQLDILQAQQKEEKPENILLKSVEKVQLVRIKDIIRIQAEGSYSKVYLNNGKNMIISRNLKDFESKLEKHTFFRTHQSHLINLKSFDSFVKSDGGYILLKNQTQIPLSNRKKHSFLEMIESI